MKSVIIRSYYNSLSLRTFEVRTANLWIFKTIICVTQADVSLDKKPERQFIYLQTDLYQEQLDKQFGHW